VLSGISFIIATAGERVSLQDTLASIECWPGDEVIVIGNVPTHTDGHVRYVTCPLGHDWGSTERNVATPLANGQYLAHIDDDDVYAPGHRALMAKAIEADPDALTIFKMQYPSGFTLWQDRLVRWGNVGTPMLLIPNDAAKMGLWGEQQDCGDLHFLQTMRWTPADIAWVPEVIAHVSQVHR
jgi:Glycosyl transferase family 2